MGYALIETSADISHYPQSLIRRSRHDEITIGDAHANTLKVIYFLILNGVLILEKGNEDYQVLKRIYETNLGFVNNPDFFIYVVYEGQQQAYNTLLSYCKADVALFTQILNKAKIGPIGSVRFIGDLLADRGNNDLLTLLVLEKLYTSKVNVEILFSNHDVEFIHYAESRCDANATNETIVNHAPLSQMPRPQIRSVFGLDFILSYGVINLGRFQELYQIYCSQLRFFSYGKGEARDEVLFFSHAPIGVEVIPRLIKQFGINSPAYMHSIEELVTHCTPLDLRKVIEQLNSIVKTDFKRVYKAIADAYIENWNDLPDKTNISAEHPLIRLCWNRDVNVGKDNINFPKRFPFKLIHGHDQATPHQGTSLDSPLGKFSFGGLLDPMSIEIWYRTQGRASMNDYAYGVSRYKLSYTVNIKEPVLSLSNAPRISSFPPAEPEEMKEERNEKPNTKGLS